MRSGYTRKVFRMIHHVEGFARNSNEMIATFLVAIIFLLNMIGALVLVSSLARFLLSGAHKGSVAGSTDAAAQAAGSTAISPHFIDQNL